VIKIRFKNTTGNAIRIRKIKGDECIWVTIKPNEIIELDEEYGYNLGLEPFSETEESNKEKVKKEELKKPSEKFLKELLSINGIGKKTLQDIISIYPTKKDLVNAIKGKKELPFRDDVVKKLIKKFR